MSVISCDACNELRQNASNFVQNGVDNTVCASLMNNTGFNPSLTVLHDNCEDLHNANDCLIGRMTDELEAYDVCDWKDFSNKYMSNLYEMLKAIICSDCGEWAKITALCESIDLLTLVVTGGGATINYMTPTAYFRQNFSAFEFGPGGSRKDVSETLFPVIEGEIRSGFGCDASACVSLFRPTLRRNAETPYPYLAGASCSNLYVGADLGFIHKSQLVPNVFNSARFDSMMRGSNMFWAFTVERTKKVWVDLLGYVVIDGVEFNADMKNTYGPDVLVMRISALEEASTGGPIGAGPDETGALKITRVPC